MAPISALDMPDVPSGQLPPHLELQRTRVVCAADAPTYVSPFSFSPCCIQGNERLKHLGFDLLAMLQLGKVHFLPFHLGVRFQACAPFFE